MTDVATLLSSVAVLIVALGVTYLIYRISQVVDKFKP
jgi:hypothetical protein